MEKYGKKGREKRSPSKRSLDKIVIVSNKEMERLAGIIDEHPFVAKWKSRMLLDKAQYPYMDHTIMRKSYFDIEWTSDFYIEKTDGTVTILEVLKKDMLFKKAVAEQLEFSRRYWKSKGIEDIKVYIIP